MVVLTMLLTRWFALRKAIAVGIGSAALVTLFWLARGNMWNVVLAATALALLLLAYRMIRSKIFMPGNLVILLCIVVASLLIPTRLESTTLSGVRAPTTPLAIPSAFQPAPRRGNLEANDQTDLRTPIRLSSL